MLRDDVLVVVSRMELEFIKNEVIETASEPCVYNKEWVSNLAEKLIEACSK